MTYTLVGTRFIGSGTMPTPIAGYDLVEVDSGNYHISNSAGTLWKQIGNVDSPNLGLGPVTGFAATGAISGAHGLAPNDNPNFTTNARLNDLNLATMADLANMSSSIMNNLQSLVTSFGGTGSGSSSAKANVTVASGTLSFPAGWTSEGSAAVAGTPPLAGFTAQTIPLPKYSDGTYAAESDCRWAAFPIHFQELNGGIFEFTDGHIGVPVDPSTTRTFAAWTLTGPVFPGIYTIHNVRVGYIIQGVRS